MPSLRSWLLQGTAVSAATATLTFFVYTKHCHYTAVSATHDPLFQNQYYRKFNPRANPAVHDLCERRIPLFKVRRELVEDAEKGGSLLIERFVGGVFGCAGSLVQRQYLSSKYRSQTQSHLWDKPDILNSSYTPGTDIINHFTVLEKSPTRILIRAGDSPMTNPNAPRASDGLLEITARADMDKGFAEFTFKSILFSGEGEKTQKPMGPAMDLAHRLYVKLLVETGVKNCMN